ncbi:hypothetical protein QOT17_024138 [Balamuthia mandrillaris]
MWRNGVRRSRSLLFATLRGGGGGALASPLWKASYAAYSTDLYRAITEATEDQAETGLLRLDDNHAWPLGSKRGMQLIVRECYPRIFELSQRLAKQRRGARGGVVFSGNPGSGGSP